MHDYDTTLPKQRRKEHGVYHTKRGLPAFAHTFMRHLGIEPDDYLTYDPCGGVGGLLVPGTGPKLASELDPELIQLMTAENIPRLQVLPDPLDFVAHDAELIRSRLPDGRLLVLTNPPYNRGDYQFFDKAHSRPNHVQPVHKDILKLVGKGNVYGHFLCQATLLGAEIIAAFTPPAWLYPERQGFRKLRDYLLSHYDYLGGFMVRGGDYFDGNSKRMPVLFSVLRRGGPTTKIRIHDLTDFARGLTVSPETILDIAPLDRFDFGPVFNSENGNIPVIKFKGRRAIASRSKAGNGLYVVTSYKWLTQKEITLQSGSGTGGQSYLASYPDALILHGVGRSVTNYPVSFSDRYLHRPDALDPLYPQLLDACAALALWDNNCQVITIDGVGCSNELNPLIPGTWWEANNCAALIQSDVTRSLRRAVVRAYERHRVVTGLLDTGPYQLSQDLLDGDLGLYLVGRANGLAAGVRRRIRSLVSRMGYFSPLPYAG